MLELEHLEQSGRSSSFFERYCSFKLQPDRLASVEMMLWCAWAPPEDRGGGGLLSAGLASLKLEELEKIRTPSIFELRRPKQIALDRLVLLSTMLPWEGPAFFGCLEIKPSISTSMVEFEKRDFSRSSSFFSAGARSTCTASALGCLEQRLHSLALKQRAEDEVPL